jgi:hypothetical protein
LCFKILSIRGKLKDRIAQLCEQYGIEFIETEESYTSKSSFLDEDSLPTLGAKPVYCLQPHFYYYENMKHFNLD